MEGHVCYCKITTKLKRFHGEELLCEISSYNIVHYIWNSIEQLINIFARKYLSGLHPFLRENEGLEFVIWL